MKKKRKISIPAAKFGIGENSIVANFKNGDTDAAIGGITGALPDAIGLLAAPFLKSTASTGKEATMQSVAAIGQGAATGFKVAGPVGAAVGAAVGMIGSGGEKANMTSFTDYDEGTLGTGLIGAFGNRKLRRERARIKQNAYSNRDAVRGTEYLLSEALEDMLGMNTDTFAVGGQTSSLAYVDDGELMRTPDGLISKVPERGKPTDSNLVNIPDGTRILSNTLKVPGTKYTFAQMADKMIKRKKSRSNDMYAQNAAKLNLMNDELMYNLLFELQELVKAKKGIKPKTKLLANAYLPGGETGKGFWDRVGEGLDRAPKPIRALLSVPSASDVAYDPKLGMSSMEFSNKMKIAKKYGLAYDRDRYGYWGAMADYANSPDRAGEFSTLPLDSYQATFGPNGEYLTRFSKHDSPEYKYWFDQTRNNLLGTTRYSMFPTSPILSRFGYRGDWSHGLQHTDLPASVTPAPTTASTRTSTGSGARTRTTASQPAAETTANSTFANYKEQPLTAAPLWRKEEGPSIPTKATPVIRPVEPSGDRKGIDWGGMLTSLSALPGIIADLNSKPEHFDAVYNPYAGAVKNTMARRRYDINPELEDITRNRAVSNYNASQFNTGTGANMAYRLQSAVNTDRAISSLRAKANNANNQYLGEYANMLNDLGRQWVTSTNLAVDQNARSRAQTRNTQRQGLSELAQLGETYAKSRNQRRRDQEMLPLYKRFLEAGFTNNDLSLLMANLPKR